MRHGWAARLRWLASAGGLGGPRVYTPGVVCGIAMSAWSYWQRDVDAPTPLIAVVAFIPYYGLAGFWIARGRSAGVGVLVGAVTAVVGFAILSTTMIVYAADTGPWPTPVAYGLYSLVFLLPAAFVGAIGGLAGDALAHTRVARSPGHRAASSPPDS